MVGVPGAVLMGLGSILGTGIFVSVGLAAEVAGARVVVAVALGAVVATFNGLSSAQLAASHPVSGGTYEYGYRYLNPALGFTAGWMFLCAKSASAATAALGLSGYALRMFGVADATSRVVVAFFVVLALTLLVAGGAHRSNRANAAIVGITIFALVVFVAAGAPSAIARAPEQFGAILGSELDPRALLHATALMFVAYTGYGRIATLGEEVRSPERSIPRAIVLSLLIAMLLYVSVTAVAIGVAGADGLAAATRSAAAPLVVVARAVDVPGVASLVGVAAVTAMAGVLLNLLLGLSRVVLAMGRRGDMPDAVARVDARTGSPRMAVFVVGALIGGLTLIGNVKTTWSFSAFSVLVYYALTNLAALRLGEEARRFPRWIAALGLASCLGLAFVVDASVWGTGVGLVALGLVWHGLARRCGRSQNGA